MVGSSILPVTFHKNKTYFLFGKETPLETSAPGWSDFGGGMEEGENVFESALREGGEELTGFLGDQLQLRKHIDHHGGAYPINYKDKYHVHVIYIPYDANLPTYYNNNHQFLWNRMDHKLLQNTKLFEKIEIGWFSPELAKTSRENFRPFYQPILDNILDHLARIKTFFRKYRKNSPKTRKLHKIL
jgi:hypothetical protein